ncbi:hypothetical protein [Nocardia sp. MW-W600-9]
MPRIVGGYTDDSVVVAVGGACVVIGPDTVDETGRCATAPADLAVDLVSTAAALAGFAAADPPLPTGLLSADQIAAVLAWEVGYVDGVPGDARRPGLSPAEVELYLRYRPDTGDGYPGAALAAVDRPFSLGGFLADPETDGATADSDADPTLIGQLCASMGYVEELAGEEIVADAATDLIDRISYLATVAEFYPALAQAVSARSIPAPALESANKFTEEQILDFLGRLVAELDRRRPWPDPALVPVDPRTWPSMGSSVPVGWVDIVISDLEWAVKADFEIAPDDDNALLVLRMRGGQLIALVGEDDPNPARFLVLLPDVDGRSEATEVRDYLARYAGLQVESDGLEAALAAAARS